MLLRFYQLFDKDLTFVEQYLAFLFQPLDSSLLSKSEIISEIKKNKDHIILTLGAGDIGEEVKYIKQELDIAS